MPLEENVKVRDEGEDRGEYTEGQAEAQVREDGKWKGKVQGRFCHFDPNSFPLRHSHAYKNF